MTVLPTTFERITVIPLTKFCINTVTVVFSIKNCIFSSPLGDWNTKYRPFFIQITVSPPKKLVNTEYRHILRTPSIAQLSMGATLFSSFRNPYSRNISLCISWSEILYTKVTLWQRKLIYSNHYYCQVIYFLSKRFVIQYIQSPSFSRVFYPILSWDAL